MKLRTKHRGLRVLGLLLCLPGAAYSLTIADIDLQSFAFDVQSYDVGSDRFGIGGDATAAGTSNGVGWSIEPTSLWTARTTTNGTFVYAALPNPTDSLHPSAFTLVFDQPVDAILFALSNDNCCESIDLGLVPVDVSGVSVTGTQVTLLSSAGGLALYENVGSSTITHINSDGSLDGFDIAFHVVSVVPLPAGGWLLASAMAAGCAWQRRARRITDRSGKRGARRRPRLGEGDISY